ncbi:unnamed protein product [Durusdinium trenchii]|uniref:Uncharacterized protein n=1 Tax=Durusdinium trenchii TaxID=1381693 RepID=A0ABP0SD87_9DINO
MLVSLVWILPAQKNACERCEESFKQSQSHESRSTELLERSTLWRFGRLLPVLAGLDELRRVSAQPQALSSPEASRLNKGAGFWAWSSIVEAALLGVVCATWARHLGCVGGSAVMAGIVASLVAALPAAVVLAVTFFGWYRADVAVANLTESHSLHPPEQLGRYDLKILEKLYVCGIADYYRLPQRPSAPPQVPMKLNDYEYYRLKVRLKAAGEGLSFPKACLDTLANRCLVCCMSCRPGFCLGGTIGCTSSPAIPLACLFSPLAVACKTPEFLSLRRAIARSRANSESASWCEK